MEKKNRKRPFQNLLPLTSPSMNNLYFLQFASWKWGNCNSIGGGSTYFGKYLTLPCSGYAVFIPFNTSMNAAKDVITFLRVRKKCIIYLHKH